MKTLLLLLIFSVFLLCDCTCDEEKSNDGNNTKALNFKLVAVASILVCSTIGVCIPVLSKMFPSIKPGTDFFLMIKGFASGVILATAFVHVLPDAFDHLTSPCLSEMPWAQFPFTGFIAMLAAIGTLLVDTFARGYYRRLHLNQALPITAEEHAEHVHFHTLAVHGSNETAVPDLIQLRVISQVLELGIVVHSVIIGISLGASDSAATIKPLLIALSFHQFFEGLGLGGCIAEAKFTSHAVVIMGIFFALTTPVGILIGIGISSVYEENSTTALIVEGIFNSASAGILIYMALVDLLAADFLSARIQDSINLLLKVSAFLLLGVGLMSMLAIWA